MGNKNQKKSKAQASGKLQWMTPEWLYDRIMKHIEPDLISKNINKLDEKYKSESKESKELRLESYELAFDLFDIAFEAFEGGILDEVKEWKKALRKRAQEKESVEEEEKMEELEEEFTDLQS